MRCPLAVRAPASAASIGRGAIAGLVLLTSLAQAGERGGPLDTRAHPVVATDPDAVQGVPMVVDGVGGQSTRPIAPYTYLHKPDVNHVERKGHLDWGGAGWTDSWTPDCSEPEAPTPERPARLKLDYGKPLEVARFALYFPRQGNMDGYLPVTAHAAAVRTLELFRSADGKTWEPVLRADPLPWTCPQVVDIPEPRPARFWLFSFEAMVPGNTALRLYEIETYLDREARIPTEPLTPPDPPAQEEPRLVDGARGTLASGEWRADWEVTDGGLRLVLGDDPRFDSSIRLFPDAAPPDSPWRGVEVPSGAGAAEAGAAARLAARVNGGWALVRLEAEPAGVRIRARMPPPREGERRRFLYLRIPVPGGRVRSMPAYFWSDRPEASAWPGWWLPTCMAAIETGSGTLALAPESDWCRIGIQGDELTLCLFPDAGEASALLLPVRGDGWRAYQAVVRAVDRFAERRQCRPTVEAATDVLRWLMGGANWSEHWGNLRSFPARPGQPPEEDFFFVFYGAPFSIPALWQRHVIAGDDLAGERVRSCVRFLIEGPARVKSGPMKGGYYSQVGGSRTQHHASDQAGNPWMASHATGAALWALLYHRSMLSKPDAEVDRAIVESADLLCRIQREDGGWDFAHLEADGWVPSGRYVDSGTIWNVWALHRAAKALGESRYLRSAERGRRWWTGQFLARHAYTGYWEDSNARGTIYPTREGYECSMAALALLEMGDGDGAVAAARDLATWIHTRTPGYRTYDTGYGNMAEQFTWPADFYLVPQGAFALGRILDSTGDPFWSPYVATAKGLGWWVDADTGGAFFPNEASGFIPIHDVPLYKNYWVDWNGAQEASRTIWWLLDAVNRSSGGAIRIDPYGLRGTVEVSDGRGEGAAAEPWLPDGSVEVRAGPDNQLNWMGYRSERTFLLAILNDLDEAVRGATVLTRPSLRLGPRSGGVRIVRGGERRTVEPRAQAGALALDLPGRSLAIIAWALR